MYKSIKSRAVNNLGYTGIVRLSQYTDGKKSVLAEVHNKGGKPLFNFLANCLVGDFDIASQDRPMKILLLNEDEKGNLTKTRNTDFIYLLTKPEKVYSESEEGIVKYSFIIPQEYFSRADFNAIGLYTNTATEAKDYAAYCGVKVSDLTFSITSVLVLDWELHISNN